MHQYAFHTTVSISYSSFGSYTPLEQRMECMPGVLGVKCQTRYDKNLRICGYATIDILIMTFCYTILSQDTAVL